MLAVISQKGFVMLDLIISASKKSWEAKPSHGTASSDKVIYQQITQKYKHTCQYCGWVDFKFNEVSHIDENHGNSQEQNLTLACPLCHQCLHLGHVGPAEGGKMIWAPELTQIEINNLARMAWILEYENDVKAKHDMYQSIKALCARLDQQSNILEANYVPDASDPSFWAEVLMKLPPEKYNERDVILKNIRLWPSMRRFRKLISEWHKQVEVNVPVKNWGSLASEKIENTKDVT
jgi:intracellular multiplication protein IcmJ